MAGRIFPRFAALISTVVILWAALPMAAQTPVIPIVPVPDDLVATDPIAPNVRPGVIGTEDRVPLDAFTPDDPEQFPGWEDAVASVVRVVCNGAASGGGVLVGDGSTMITAGHVFFDDTGNRAAGQTPCAALHPGGDAVPILTETLKSGGFSVPPVLEGHFSVPITARDWAVVQLARVPEGARPLAVATRNELVLLQGYPVLNIAGPQQNFDRSGIGVDGGFVAQICRYFGVPPTASDVNGAGAVFGRVAEPEDQWTVARFDCDLGRGGSGSPVIGWYEGRAYLWGIMTDSLRGQPVCAAVGRTSCYSAGPLVTGMDLVE